MVREPVWRILLVDDDEDDYMITRDMLSETRGRKSILEWASSFEEGRQVLQRDHFDVVLMDYDLGHKTGLELIREGTEQEYPAPFILLTGRGNYEVDVEAMHAGATLYLTKAEVNALLLERSIRYAIERKQIEQELRNSRNELQQANQRLTEELIERQRVEAQLRYSEERFNKAFKVSPNAQVLSRLDNGTILDINDSFEKVFGYSRDEVIGKTSLELNMFFHPEDRQEAINRLRKEKRLRDFELEIRTKTGDARLACLGIEILTVGEDVLMLTSVEDITERTKLEEEKRRLSEQYATMFNSVREGFAHYKAIYDNQGKLVDILVQEINPAGAKISGVPREAQVGKTWRQVWPGVEEKLFEMYKHTDETGEMIHFEDDNRLTGRIYDVAIYKIAPGEFVATFFDITERKQMEEALRKSERKYREYYEYSQGSQTP